MIISNIQLRWIAFLLAGALILGACQPQVSPTASISAANGDAVRGQVLFTEKACLTCHVVATDAKLVGPSLQGIGTTAATRQVGVSAEQYLIESIHDPNAYIVEGYVAGLMPQTYKETLSTAEVSDLVAYMLTLK